MMRPTLWMFPAFLTILVLILVQGGYAEKKSGDTPAAIETKTSTNPPFADEGELRLQPRRTEDEQALHEILDEGKEQVRAAMARMENLSPSERIAVHREVEQIKRTTRIRLLQTQMSQALRRDDQLRYEEAQRLYRIMIQPHEREFNPPHRDPPPPAKVD